MTRLGLWMIVIAIFFFGYNIAIAHDYHHHESTTVQQAISNETKGIPLGLAIAAIDCNMSSDKWHGGVSAGFYNDVTAPAIGACKRYGNTMIKGSFGFENGNYGGNIGMMFQF